MAITVLAGCAGVTHVVSTGPDSYMVAAHGMIGGSSAGEQKAKAFDEASAYCRGLGKELEPTNVTETDSGLAKHASAEVHFRCVGHAAN
jgi:hypothetical protein